MVGVVVEVEVGMGYESGMVDWLIGLRTRWDWLIGLISVLDTSEYTCRD